MTCASKSTQTISSASFSRNGLCSSEPPTKKMRLSILRDITVPVQSAVPCPKGDLRCFSVEKMQEEIKNLKHKLAASQKRAKSLERENENLHKGIDKYFNKDQLQSLHKSTMHGTAWQDETLVKALKLRLSCGSQGYSVVRELASPLPTERTIQRRIEGFKFTPGILTEMFDILKIKISVLSEQERHTVLMLDEIQLTKGMDFDPSTVVPDYSASENYHLPGLAFADDLVVMAESSQDLQSLLDICQTEVTSLGLRFNTKKSAVVCLAGGNTDAAALTLGGEPLTARNDYRYLGVTLCVEAAKYSLHETMIRQAALQAQRILHRRCL
ncbi:uncharacterized protein LOC125756680 [Rhipicephalus sanguineus]|uniref:uncharacterized protein LOC125756680 n=1 Tax=Rhipicephalus sanguineus TaxID=34632 RepID=UPI0020C375C4|nr:uncharacterized protein LOC125756680 [Rhipicephalus sanguineus]